MRTQTRQAYHCVLLRMIEHIAFQRGPLKVPDLAGFAGFSKFHLSRFFTRTLGETMGQFTRRMRLERAAYFLLTTSRAVRDIAIEAGYSGSEAFGRSFNVAFGMSPTEFREDGTLSWQIPSDTDLHWSPDLPLLGFTAQVDSDIAMNIVARPRVRVACLRHNGPYDEVYKAWERLERLLPNKPWQNLSSRFMTIFHDNCATHHDPKTKRSDVGFTVPKGYELPSEMHLMVIPGGVFAATKKYLPLKERWHGWGWMNHTWVPSSGARPVNVPAIEEYREWPLPWDTAHLRLLVGLQMDLGDPDQH